MLAFLNADVTALHVSLFFFFLLHIHTCIKYNFEKITFSCIQTIFASDVCRTKLCMTRKKKFEEYNCALAFAGTCGLGCFLNMTLNKIKLCI